MQVVQWNMEGHSGASAIVLDPSDLYDYNGGIDTVAERNPHMERAH